MDSSRIDIPALFVAQGGRHYGESVTQLAHGLQCAAHARAAGADDDLVLAALLHDVGHFRWGAPGAPQAPHAPRPGGAGALRGFDPEAPLPESETPTRHHGEQGARLIAPYVPERVAWIVEHHVIAKRYLCAVDAEYAASLSPASVRSLKAQGGPLGVEECRAFERARWFEEAVAVRRWDDLAKDPTAVVAPLDAYGALFARYSLA